MNNSTREFLSSLRGLDVQLSLEGGQLRCTAPTGVVTAELRGELAARKYEIVTFLGQANLAKMGDPIHPVNREGELPLSFAQQRLWLLNHFEPGSFAANIPSYFLLKGTLNIQALEDSFSEIVRRHEVLRSVYKTLDGRPVLEVARPQRFKVQVFDLEGLTEDEQRSQAEHIAQADVVQPFDLTQSPMLRVKVLKISSESSVLLLNFCHIAFDGWSFSLLVKELSALYPAFLRGEPSPLAELPIQYVDFAAWQRRLLQDEVLETQLNYWRQKLSGSRTVLELPADHPRPTFQTGNGGSVVFNLSASVTEDVRTLSQREGVTPFVLLFTAFSTLLLRYSGQDDILVGTPVANRNRTETEELIGFFVNTLVLRADLSGNPTFRTALQRLHDFALGAFAHQDLPFEKLVEALNPKRDVSHSPIFQVMFSLDHAAGTPLTLPGLAPAWPEFKFSGAQFDLSLYLTETNNSIEGRFSYNSDIFDRESIVQMAKCFETLLGEMIRNPQQRVQEVQLLTPVERQTLLATWSRTDDDLGSAQGIHQLIALSARRTPNAVALECDSERLTYRELDDRSDRLAGHLQTLGVGPETLVAVCMERSAGMAVALLAILKAGASYLPLDLAAPPDRVAFMLEDAKPLALVTETDLQDKLPAHQSIVVCLDHFSWTTEQAPIRPTEPLGRAYLLYTSGSTGKPKGVEVCHRAVVNFLQSMRTTPGIKENDVLLSITTYSFDIFGLELWLPLATGAKVVIATSETCKDSRLLAQLIASSKATVMQGTPTTWRMLIDAGWQGNPRIKILCGGEAWPKDLALNLLPKCGSLWNMYGPTETTIWSAVYQVRADGEVRVGPPVANTQFYIVDSNLQLLPPGVPGELLIGGEGLARGYLNRPELTTEKFIPNTFGANPQGRLYRTGDLVRSLPDGTLEFLSRMDHQVKLRGFRIELGEIETLLRTSPSLSEAVVVLRSDDEPRLVAYCVLAEGSSLAASDLRQLLKSRLPDYMVPSEFVFLENLPLTPNGKIDRKALQALPRTPRQVRLETVEPRDHLERQLTALWEKILQVHPVYPSDNFFDLGGHSFAAVHLMSEIQKLTGKTLPLATLFQAGTVESLAQILRKNDEPSWSALVPIRPGGSKPPLFLVHGAEGNLLLYRQFVQHLGSDQPVYGLQSRGLNGDEVSATSIEEMASSYVREILSLQPEGPYILGGYCLGGLIAYEMAQQLTAAGRQVPMVLMLETYNANTPFPPPPNNLSPLHGLQNAWFHSANIAMIPTRARRDFFREKLDIARIRMTIRLRALSSGFERGGEKKIQRKYPHLLIKKLNDEAAFRYVPAPYNGRVAVIKPKRYFAGLDSESFGWGELAGDGLEVHEVTVYPKGMLVEPFCRSLADIVKRCLANASVTELTVR